MLPLNNNQGSCHWAEAASFCSKNGEAFVLITIIGQTGSAPRDMGTKMLVNASGVVSSIGGGHLEHIAIKKALELLKNNLTQQHIEEFPLGAKLGQCCGGRVTLLFECFPCLENELVIFGAGHIGKALINIVTELPLRVTWIDSRTESFPQSTPAKVKTLVAQDPQEEIKQLPAGAQILVMTHKHPVDYEIVKAALKRGDFSYIGLIGSETKAKRFRLRLKHYGFDDGDLKALRCPVGLSNVPGKQPMEIAVSIAGELIGMYHQTKSEGLAVSERESSARLNLNVMESKI